MTHLAGKALDKHNKTVIHTVEPNALSHVLTGLEIYAVYRIRIRAFTVKGDGVSTEISAGNFRYRINSTSVLMKCVVSDCLPFVSSYNMSTPSQSCFFHLHCNVYHCFSDQLSFLLNTYRLDGK